MFVGVDTFGVGKPDPRVFLEGCARLSLPADAVAYVGDEPDIDAGERLAQGSRGSGSTVPAPAAAVMTARTSASARSG
ncbi:hypothetical protein GCM10025876_06410 [Demequina litorisediminis]|uniref:Phosphoglycolate phosphatase n=1 Tax=Demequina litorisediminis TaxID=1849022 RepID=A0ABQ6I9B0_9MICO|nr:hypothetical protein GCM10025876_06410 [Demequina litorisediminis]